MLYWHFHCSHHFSNAHNLTVKTHLWHTNVWPNRSISCFVSFLNPVILQLHPLDLSRQLKDNQKNGIFLSSCINLFFSILKLICYTFWYGHIRRTESLGNLKNLFNYHKGKLTSAPTWLKANLLRWHRTEKINTGKKPSENRIKHW